jgi:hypothetical protein
LIEVVRFNPQPEAHTVSALAAHGQFIAFYDRHQMIDAMAIVDDAVNARNRRSLTGPIER